MDKKLEARIAKLERMMGRKSVKNEISHRDYDAITAIDSAAFEVKKATFKLYRLIKNFGDDGLNDLFYTLSAAADEMVAATGAMVLEKDIDD